MKRTTVALEDGLLRELKKRAAGEGRSLQDVIGDLLRQALANPRKRRYRLPPPRWEAREQPGVDILDRDKLYDLMGGR
jgi:hypothetical protein